MRTNHRRPTGRSRRPPRHALHCWRCGAHIPPDGEVWILEGATVEDDELVCPSCHVLHHLALGTECCERGMC